MSVELNDGTVRLVGRCGVEDVEPLLQHLLGGAGAVDLRGCEQLHTAILQLLMAADRGILGDLPEPYDRWSLLGSSERGCEEQRD